VIILPRYLTGQFVTMFSLALVFFVLSLMLTDLLVNLSRFLPMGTALPQVFELSFLYLPQALSWALSPALLFSVSFVLGTLYSHNELVVILGSGISLRQFTVPLFLFGALASLFLFFWNDQGVIPTERQRSALQRTLNGTSNLNNTNVALLSRGGSMYYWATTYNDAAKTLTGVILVYKQDDAQFEKRVDAEWAVWKESAWELHKVKTYEKTSDGKVGYRYDEVLNDAALNDPPPRFQRKSVTVSELSFHEAQLYVETLKAGGLPSADAETDTFQRISFSFSPFVVIWISAAIGGRFRKNILLMSLLTSLLVSAGFIILQMVAGLLAKTGFLPPWFGAAAGVLAGLVVGGLLFIRART